MVSNELEINNKVNLEKNNMNLEIQEKQNKFLETTLGKVINQGLNLGLKAVLPDIVEDQVIEIKDSLLSEGFSEALKTGINNAIELGKSVVGIFTGKFENMSQVKNVIKKGGLLDTVSDLINKGISKIEKQGKINKNISKVLESGKNTILNTINNNIENNLTSQMKSIENLDKYISKWKEYYEEKDFSNMSKQFTKIEKELGNIMPLENIIIKARQLENIHNLIKNNGKNFNLSKEELELANKLI